MKNLWLPSYPKHKYPILRIYPHQHHTSHSIPIIIPPSSEPSNNIAWLAKRSMQQSHCLCIRKKSLPLPSYQFLLHCERRILWWHRWCLCRLLLHVILEVLRLYSIVLWLGEGLGLAWRQPRIGIRKNPWSVLWRLLSRWLLHDRNLSREPIHILSPILSTSSYILSPRLTGVWLHNLAWNIRVTALPRSKRISSRDIRTWR